MSSSNISAQVTATGVVQILTVAATLRVKLVKREVSPNSSFHSDMECIEDDSCKTPDIEMTDVCTNGSCDSKHKHSPDIEMTDVSTNGSSDNEMNRIYDDSCYTDIKQAYSSIMIVSDTSVSSNNSSNASNLSLELPMRPSSTQKKSP